MRTTTPADWASASCNIQSSMQRCLPRYALEMQNLPILSTTPQQARGFWTAPRTEPSASKQFGQQRSDPWFQDSHPNKTWSSPETSKATCAVGSRTSAPAGTETTPHKFCSARSQVRGCLNGGAKQSSNSGIAVRVDGQSSEPSGAILANKEERSRARTRSKAGKRAYQRAMKKAAREGSAVFTEDVSLMPLTSMREFLEAIESGMERREGGSFAGTLEAFLPRSMQSY